MDKSFARALAAVLASALAGCASRLPPPAPPAPLFVESASSYTPPPLDKAQVVFLAPSATPAAAAANAIFEIDGGQRTLLAALAAHGGSIQSLPPGHHVLMAYGRAGHLIEAELEGGARYYVLLRPLDADDLQPLPVQRREGAAARVDSPDFYDWDANTTLVDKTAAADAWFSARAAQVDAAQAAAQSAWQRKTPQERAALTLTADDAVLRQGH